ncbi:hypothetical protein PPN31114_00195 [Pandoraea pneumonica]|uniref:TIR domain-containing protein n=1 Tax=Pandoraea pneumonica TaxID=2508299 RepID=A0A5E4RID9_9BURK|nr:toll/interleukin-1 receptor domain-containing protein [Pandoraea pneumonica]VVD62895.1 hypothetical protein PPN31114_00195 [Pandoraea pneumonica]
MASLFFSYCHADEDLRDQLEVHLSMLKRNGLIETWHDRRIVAGDNIDNSISEQLEGADVILLLVSADFINSAYCYSKEMSRALERSRNGEARTIAVILRQCDWQTAPFADMLALPKDARPVTSWPNRDEAFTDIAKAIRKSLESTGLKRSMHSKPSAANEVRIRPAETTPRSSNLRVRKDFSELERDTYIADAFNFMAAFFEGSLSALQERHPDFKGRFERIDSRSFTASIYKEGKCVTQCAISLGGYGRGHAEIRYSNNISAYSNSFNEALTVGADSQKLFLKPMMSMSGTAESQLSESGAAEYLWATLMERIQ